jgi:hypothetical protein
MVAHTLRQVSEAVLRRVDVRRREFLRQIIGGGAFVAPAMASFPLVLSSATSGAGDERAESEAQSPTRTLFPVADAVLREASPSTNEGANPFLRVGAPPATRAALLFDADEVAEAWQAGPQAVTLTLTIANNHNSWGQGDDRTVDAHPLLEPFTEGSGQQLGLPKAQARRGSGPGVTWNAPEDAEVGDGVAASTSTDWQGGNFGPNTARGAPHFNRQEGQVSWDVAQDVEAGRHGWILKLRQETGGPQSPLGWDNAFGGGVDYFSRHAQGTPGAEIRPRLTFTYATGT